MTTLPAVSPSCTAGVCIRSTTVSIEFISELAGARCWLQPGERGWRGGEPTCTRSFCSPVTYSCIICYGFHTGHNSTDISSTPVKSPLPLDAAPQLSFLRCSSCARYLASAEALNLRRIHRNQSTTRRETVVEINQSLRGGYVNPDVVTSYRRAELSILIHRPRVLLIREGSTMMMRRIYLSLSFSRSLIVPLRLCFSLFPLPFESISFVCRRIVSRR